MTSDKPITDGSITYPFTCFHPVTFFAKYLATSATKLIVVILCGLFSSALSAAAAPNENAANHQKLEDLQQQISALRKELEQAHEQHADVNQQLAAIEIRINKQTLLLRKVNKQIALQEKQLKHLNAQQSSLLERLDENHADLAMQVRANYSLGRQEYLKLLLSQKNPATVSRTLTYYDYFNQARVHHINDITTDLDEVQRVSKQINSTKAELEEVRNTRQLDKQTLEQSRHHRNLILSKLNQDIDSADARLQHLIEDEQSLRTLIKQLGQRPPPAIDENVTTKAFHQLQGQLIWPTSGKVIASYGSKRSSGDLQWKGVLIAAPEGSEVRAISYGHVVYANWLRGFGLLLIVDHGDGYMSLYGHNESLFKDLGEWVEPNEVIASVGSSGGFAGSALYFEIRHNGKPTNPVAWLKK